MPVSCVDLQLIVLAPDHHCCHHFPFHSRLQRAVDRILLVAVVSAVFVPILARHPDHLEYDKIAKVDAVPKYGSFAYKVVRRPHKQVAVLVDRPPLASGLPAA